MGKKHSNKFGLPTKTKDKAAVSRKVEEKVQAIKRDHPGISKERAIRIAKGTTKGAHK